MRLCITTFLVITVVLFSCTAKKEREKSFVNRITKEVTGTSNTDSVVPPEITIRAAPQMVTFTKTVAKGNKLKAGAGINYFTSYNAEHGFPIGRVMDLLFDKEGMVWINQLTNVLKYDGVGFTSYGKKNGMSSVGILSLAQDGKGNIWMNRFSGLSKYDGFAFTNYDTVDVLKGNRYTIDLKNDHEGNLWFSVLGKGICKYDGISFTLFSTRHGLPSDSIFINMIDKKGKLWLTFWDGGSGTFDGKKYQAFTKDDWTGGKTVKAIFRDSKDNIWYRTSQRFNRVGGFSGLNVQGNMKFDDGIMKFDGHKTTRYTFLDGLPSNMINDLTEDSTGNIWFATDKGVSGYDGIHFTNYTTEHGLSHDITRQIMTDPSGNIWVLGYTGMSRFNGTYFNQYTAATGFNGTDNGIVRFVNDSMGNLWFTVLGGIGKYDGNEFTYFTKPGNTSSESGINFGALLSAGDGSIWFSTGSKGCYRFDGKTFLFYPEINNLITGIFQDSKGIFWFSTPGSGVYEFDGKEYTHYTKAQGLNGNNIFNTAEDRSGNIWLGRRDGFSKYDGNHFSNYDFIQGMGNGNSSREIVAGKNDLVWYASDSGLIKFDGRSITNYGNADGLADGSIRKIVEDTVNKKIWITTGNGLSAINTALKDEKTGKEMVENYNFQTGFPELSKDFNGANIDGNGVLWLSATNKTLTRFDYGQLKKRHLPKLLIHNVTLDNENICWHNLRSSVPGNKRQDSMIIANEFGLRFNKEASAAVLNDMADRFAGIAFDSISRGNPVPFQLKIPFRHNTIGFEFGVIDPNHASQVQYQYVLEGYDKTWSKLGNVTKASFGNMNEGKYIFRVKALSTNGQWIETSYAFVVLPPWYRTWWAYALYILAACMAIYTFIRWRTKALQKEKTVLEEKVTTRTAELKESLEHLKSTQSQLIQSEKMASLGELTAGIAHEIQNPLNFVNNFSEVNKELAEELEQEIDKGNYTDAKALAKDIKENEEKINHHGKRADAIVKGMLQHSRNSSGTKEPTDINALCDEYLRLSYHGLRAKEKTFNATIPIAIGTDFDESIGNINIIPQDIGRVVLNLINNAFYAVDEKKNQIGEGYEPTVSVSTKKVNGKVEVRVKDNGNGIPQKVLDKIFQPFFTTKPTGQGTGLGLSLSYDIVKAHGGSIQVESIEGDGTLFTLSLAI